MKLTIQLLISIILASCAPLQSSSSDAKIIGGTVIPGNPEQRNDYSSALGFQNIITAKKCMATRIGDNLFLTAAHCIDDSKEGAKTSFVASNNRMTTAPIVNLRLAPGYKSDDEKSLDLATFSIAFYTVDQKTIFDRFVTIAQMRSDVKTDGKVIIVGYGCESAFEVGLPNCTTAGSFSRFKIAKATISSEPSRSRPLYFELNNNVTSASTDGVIGAGDSGGPVFDEDKNILGVNHGSWGLTVGTHTVVGKSLHVWIGSPSSQSFISTAPVPSSQYFEGAIVQAYEYQLDKNGIPFGGVKEFYNGALARGKRNGYGSMTYNNGRIYTGFWVDDVKQGEGETFFEEANTQMKYFKGTYIAGVPSGEAYIVYKSGDTYKGGIIKGTESGHGVQTFLISGDSEEGEFKAGLREGRFVLTRKDGSKYVIIYSNNIRQGEPEKI